MASSAHSTQRCRLWYLAGLMTLTLFLPSIPLPTYALEDPVSPRQPPVTIVIKGGAGTIKADRVWNEGANLCWESRGVRNCTLRRWVSYIQYTGVPDPIKPTKANLLQVEGASLRQSNSGLRFVGQVRNGSAKRWSHVTLVVRFLDRKNKLVGHDEVRIVPNILQPNERVTFDHDVPPEKRTLYIESDASRGSFKRHYSLTGIP